MKTITFALLTLSICVVGFGQIRFEKGFFINNQNQKTECFIKNIDGVNNPTSFKYKLTESAEAIKAEMKEVKEFVIYNAVKFVRANVDIDTSSSSLKELSTVRSPLWAHKQLFLKLLIEGKASLFYYSDARTERFFYSINDSVIKQLVCKEYLYESDRTALNEYYKQQLINDLKCSKTNFGEASSLTYEKKDLEKFFYRYNQCADTTYLRNTPTKQHSNKLHVLFFAGIEYSSLSIGNDAASYLNFDFGGKLNGRLGVGIEYTLPFNKNKWGIVIESNYQSFKGEKQIYDNPHYSRYASIEFKSIDFGIGLKHYFFLSQSRIFIDAFFNSIHGKCISFKLETGSSATSKYQLDADKFKIRPYGSLGAGFEYKRFYTEVRYNFTANIFDRRPSYFSEYKKLSLVLGYKLF